MMNVITIQILSNKTV